MPKSIKNIISAKFERNKGSLQQTFLFDKFDPEGQFFILTKTGLSIDKCIIIRYENQQNWLLITESSLIISQDDKYDQIDLTTIERIEPNVDLEKLNRENSLKPITS